MPITPFLGDRVFEPELIQPMSAAFSGVCAALGLSGRADRITELVARQIIDLAQRGVHTQAALYLLTMQEFKANPQ
jgi:hypothetical protein